jgi:hypothetical protein
MILVIDIANERTRAALIGARRSFWRTAPGRDGFFSLLAALKRSRRLPSRGAAGVIALVSRPGAVRDASWSAVRAAVATANALAFAWGVSAATLPIEGDESESEIARLATTTLRQAGKRARATAAYDGEPNITKPRK